MSGDSTATVEALPWPNVVRMTVEAASPAGADANQLRAPRFSTQSIVGFVLAFPIPLAGLVVSIIAWAQARKTGDRKGLAIAGVIVSVLGILFIIACLALILPTVIQLLGMCGELGPGTHQIDGATYTCGTFGSSVVYR